MPRWLTACACTQPSSTVPHTGQIWHVVISPSSSDFLSSTGVVPCLPDIAWSADTDAGAQCRQQAQGAGADACTSWEGHHAHNLCQSADSPGTCVQSSLARQDHRHMSSHRIIKRPGLRRFTTVTNFLSIGLDIMPCCMRITSFQAGCIL